MKTPYFVRMEPGSVNFLSPQSPYFVKILTEGRASFSKGSRQYMISQAFEVMAHPVTRGFWYSIMKTTPWSRYASVNDRILIGNDEDLPADCLSPSDCYSFADAASKYLGRPVRLPTELEYEYYASGGSQCDLHWTNATFASSRELRQPHVIQEADQYEVFGNAPDIEVPLKRMVEVGTRKPNGFGIFDAIGLVSEFVSDKSDRSNKFPSKPKLIRLPDSATDYHNTRGEYFIAKGGEYSYALDSIVRYNRCLYGEDEWTPGSGLRLVAEL